MAICILVLEDEKTAFDFWEKLKAKATPISNFQVINPSKKQEKGTNISQELIRELAPMRAEIKDVKLFNPKLSRKERQAKMSLWLMPFGFIAGLTFAGMTDLKTFSSIGFGQINETFLGGLLGMGAGWIGSFFGARSVNSSQEDLKGLIKFNQQGFWLVILETPFETELPWSTIKEMKPIEVVNLSLI